MTPIGKILVFFNLIFALVVSGLIMTAYSANKNWKDVADKQIESTELHKTAIRTATSKLEESVVRHKKENEELTKVIDSLRKQIDETAKQLIDAKAKIEEAREGRIKADAAQQAATATSKSYEEKYTQVLKEKTDLVASLAESRKEASQLLADRNALEVQIKVLQNKNEKQLKRVEELELANTDLRKQLTTEIASGLRPAGPVQGMTVSNSSATANGVTNIRGKIDYVTDKGLVQISIGSDVGVTNGQSLDVFRLDPVNPKNSRYLGKVQINATEPKMAVGVFVPAINGLKAKPDDEVSFSSAALPR